MALMHILAKSVLDEKQLASRAVLKQELPIKGIEILLRDKDFQDIEKTAKWLIEIGNKYKILGLETGVSTIIGGKKIAINPISHDAYTRTIAKQFLARYVSLINNVMEKTSAQVYAQWQLLGEPYGPDRKPSQILSHSDELKKLQTYHLQLQSQSHAHLQMENGVPINPNGTPSKPEEFYNDFIMTRIEDYRVAGMPAALDVTHLALSLNCWAHSEPQGALYKLNTKNGTFYFQQTQSDVEAGERIKKAMKNGASLRESITDELIRVVLTHKKEIGSLQFADAERGFGTDENEQGYHGTDGLINMQRLFQEAIIPADIPYVIPEYHETDYTNPIHQKKAIKDIARWIT
jgi:hypothetical protein